MQKTNKKFCVQIAKDIFDIYVEAEDADEAQKVAAVKFYRGFGADSGFNILDIREVKNE